MAVPDTTGAGMVWGLAMAYDSVWWAGYTTFTATAEGVARVRLEMPTTTGALLWDDVEVMPTYDSCGKAVKLKYYPYGQEVGTVTANDRVKFGTYTRDAATGLDYAMNRYYQSTWGRFTSPDPYRASGGPGDPGSWNRYSYVQGDPVNFFDPAGLFSQDACYGQPGCQYQASADMLGIGDSYNDRGFLGYGEGGAEYSALPQGLLPGNDASEEANPEQDPDCEGMLAELRRLINAVRGDRARDPKGLAQRFNQLFKMKGSELNSHVLEFKNRQRQFIKKVNKYKPPCGDPPSDVMEWVDKEVPSQIRDQAARVGLGLVLGYTTYRIIRVLPSLLPPFWWTLPPNLALP